MSEARTDEAAAVRQWLLDARQATLCTLAADEAIEGHPFGSLVPYALAADGRPLLLISEIAQHTRNVERDPRVTLFVADPEAFGGGGDGQASWRVGVIGRARRIDASDEVRARYLERVPDAADYHRTHDFGYWTIDPERVRAIGGFGRIRWLDGDAVLRDPGGEGLAAAAPGIIDHMNADHADALGLMCEAFAGVRCKQARLEQVDRTGMLVRTSDPDALLHLSYGREISADEARKVFVDLTRRARAALA